MRFLLALLLLTFAQAITPFRIHIEDAQTHAPVPLITLTTTHHVSFTSDNDGNIAFDLPEFMNREIWLTLHADGYELPADGFGYRGFRCTPKESGTHTIQVKRTSAAQRIARITGAGLLSESQKCGLHISIQESGITGCDSVQAALHEGKMFWLWGDTSVPQYPLGVFHSTGSITASNIFSQARAPLLHTHSPMRSADGRIHPLAALPGDGPTWLSALCSLPDQNKKSHLVALYRKIQANLNPYETGLCEWVDAKKQFQITRTLWIKADGVAEPLTFPDGHAVLLPDGKIGFGNPFLTLIHEATYEAWKDHTTTKLLDTPAALTCSITGRKVIPHSGSMAWHAGRKMWQAIFVEKSGATSFIGDVWFAEAPSPTGPWLHAVNVISHAHYSFYNPRILHECVAPDADYILFEGTYTKEFSGTKHPTPRYDYNQVLYRLNFSDLPQKK